MDLILKKVSSFPFVFKNFPISFKIFWLYSLFKNNKKSIIFAQDFFEKEILCGLESLGLKNVGEKVKEINPAQKFLLIISKDKLDFAIENLKNLKVKNIKVGQEIDFESLIEELIEEGYEKVDFVEKEGEFSKRGYIFDIFPFNSEYPYRVELEGDEIISIRKFDPSTQRSFEKIESFSLVFETEDFVNQNFDFDLIEEREEVLEKVSIKPLKDYAGRLGEFLKDIEHYKKIGYDVYLFVSENRKILYFKDLIDIPIFKGEIFKGFIWEDKKLVVFSEYDLHKFIPLRRKERREYFFGARIEDISNLKPGDYVVHFDYGIAKFEGMETLSVIGAKYDCLVLRFKDGVKLYVPVYQMDKVHKFVAGEGYIPTLSSFGSRSWFWKKVRAYLSAKEFAEKLIKRGALRKLRKGYVFKGDEEMERELENSFPYEETPAQRRAVEDVKKDMQSEKVMDRLICGDVGYGKTEVALRASFKAVLSGKQVAILVPTTLLALQHFRTFKERLKNFPIRIEMLSRLTPKNKVKQIIGELADGKVDIIIGTHRILQPDIKFKDLGLLIIDEEHKFGVEQKEKILQRFGYHIDRLFLTATPIPRTLYASMGKIIDMSVIDTPPPERKSVKTFVELFSWDIVKKAIEFEISRGGQVFYVHNRIEKLKEILDNLRRMFPDLKIEVAHGRLKKNKIEEIFMKLLEGEIDILICTSIIGSGVDFPNVNTMIVEGAELFGLAELHQLRGRVGRGWRRAYVYFLHYPNISKKAKERLNTIARFQHLGAGFKIALKDLEIRGAGNLLGKEQHGFAKQVGYELYFSMIEKAVNELLKGKEEKELEIKTVNFSYGIPVSYIEKDYVRLGIYKKLSQCKDFCEVDEIAMEIIDRFGKMPKEFVNLLNLTKIKIWAKLNEFENVAINGDLVIYKKDGEIFQKKLSEILEEISFKEVLNK